MGNGSPGGDNGNRRDHATGEGIPTPSRGEQENQGVSGSGGNPWGTSEASAETYQEEGSTARADAPILKLFHAEYISWLESVMDSGTILNSESAGVSTSRALYGRQMSWHLQTASGFYHML